LLESPSLQSRRETMMALMEYALHACGKNDDVLQ
jgi:hypothetical protein